MTCHAASNPSVVNYEFMEAQDELNKSLGKSFILTNAYKR